MGSAAADLVVAQVRAKVNISAIEDVERTRYNLYAANAVRDSPDRVESGADTLVKIQIPSLRASRKRW